MLFKYIKGEFSTEYNVTVGVEFNSKTVEINEKTSVMLQVWDTVGLQAYHRQDRRRSRP
jgi:Ras-related protein Rab-2A